MSEDTWLYNTYQWVLSMETSNHLNKLPWREEKFFSLKSRIFKIMKGHDKFSYFETQNDNNDN